MSIARNVGRVLRNTFPGPQTNTMPIARSMGTGARMLGGGATKAAFGAVLAGAAVRGFSGGVGNADVSSAMYEFASGDPNIDEYIFGTDIGMRELFAPLPGERPFNTTRHMFNRQTIGRSIKNQQTIRSRERYGNNLPTISGDMVFGMYNSRMG